MKLRMCEVVLYQEHFEKIEDITTICDTYKSIQDYAVILHDKDVLDDGTLKKPHYHLMIRFKTSFETDKMLSWFNIKSNAIEKIKGRFADGLLYLTHENAPHKYQYGLEEVKSNFDFNKERKQKAKKEEVDRILQDIADGKIRPYEFADMIPDLIYIKNERLIKIAYDKYLKKRLKDITRNIQVVFIGGTTGTGKTTLAKMWCEDRKKSYSITSSNNDIMQDYQGEDVLILDDFRDSVFKFNDLLKILDNNVNTSIQSRYKNKFFVGDTIIITSSIDIFEWYQGYQERDDNDNIKQLYRRINTHIWIKGENMMVSRIDHENASIQDSMIIENPVYDKYIKKYNPSSMYDEMLSFVKSKIQEESEIVKLAEEYKLW